MSASQPKDTRNMASGNPNLARMLTDLPPEILENAYSADGLGAALYDHETGTARPVDPDSEKDRLAAKGVQAWLDAGKPGIPVTFVLRAMQAAGYQDHNGTPIAKMISDIEAAEADAAKPTCHVAWALTEWAFGYVATTFIDLASESLAQRDVATAVRSLALARELQRLRLSVEEKRPDGAKPISGLRLHHMLAEAGWTCPDIDLTVPFDETEEEATRAAEAEDNLASLLAMIGHMADTR